MTNRYTNVPKSDNKPENVVIIRGGGDLASGTIHRLYRCGYRLLVLTEFSRMMQRTDTYWMVSRERFLRQNA